MRLLRRTLLALILLGLSAPSADAAPLVRADDGWAAKVSTRGERLTCLQAGELRRGRLGRRLVSGFRALRPRDFLICGAGTRGPRTRATLVRTALDRPGGERARRVAVLAGGLAGRGAVRAEVSSGGRHRRTVAIRPDGAWLAVLPPKAEQAQLRIVVRYRGGRREVSDYGRGQRRTRVVPGSSRIEVRDVDPVTDVPLGLLVWRTTRGETCSAPGEMADGQIGQTTGLAGEFAQYPINDGGSCSDLSELNRSSEPLSLSVGATYGDGPPRARISGFARSDVTSLVVRGLSPEPRALRPSSRSRAFLANARLPEGATGIPTVSIDLTYADGRTETLTFDGTPPSG